MNVVGNCPQCGNPIYASSPDDVRRTCLCALTMRPVTIPVQPPQPYGPVSPWVQPLTPWIQPGQWWCSDPSMTITATANTSGLAIKGSEPPDADAGMVPR